mmetsp:Transcript_10935/g.27706  ORF Transcript_10935/g.27706 Transcript_10935/m.27706 type:complete len:219 (-) Transcript_10935:181-837(-)
MVLVCVRGVSPPKDCLEKHIVTPLGLERFVSLECLADMGQVVVKSNVTHLVDTVGKGNTVLERKLVQELGHRQGFAAVLCHGSRRNSVVRIVVVRIVVRIVARGRFEVLLHELHAPQVIAQSSVEDENKGFVLNGGGVPFGFFHYNWEAVDLVVLWSLSAVLFLVVFLLSGVRQRLKAREGSHSRDLASALCGRSFSKDFCSTIGSANFQFYLLLLLL